MRLKRAFPILAGVLGVVLAFLAFDKFGRKNKEPGRPVRSPFPKRRF